MRMLIQALALLALWTFATVAPTLHQAGGEASMAILVSKGLQWGFLAAPAVLAAAVLVLRWDRIGLKWPKQASGFILTWPSLLTSVAIAVAVTLVGLPPARALGFIAINTFLVGISEELMFRGLLFRGLVDRLSFWTTFWLTSVLFGGVHLLNGLITGDFTAAAVQAGSAFLSALFFLAVRLRAASLYPSILAHWTWDLAVLTLALALTRSAPSPHATTTTTGIAGLLVSLPFALYGLFLMRKGRAACPEWAMRDGAAR